MDTSSSVVACECGLTWSADHLRHMLSTKREIPACCQKALVRAKYQGSKVGQMLGDPVLAWHTAWQKENQPAKE